MMRKILILLIFAMCLCTYAKTIEITAPYTTTVSEGDIIDLGTIGPGQTIYIDFNPRVEGIGWWDIAEVSDLPEAWYGKNSKIYEDPLHVRVTSSKNAAEGDYSFKITVIDERNINKLGTITVTCKIRIRHDIMDMQVSPSQRITGAGQPARVDIIIKNKGNTEEEFVVYSEGVIEWSFKKHIYIAAKSEKQIIYEIVGNEEETYEFNIIAESRNSPQIIREEEKVTVKVYPNLIADMKATNNGQLLFPVIYSPMHSLLGIISNFFK